MLLPPASTCQEGYPVLKHELSHQKVDHPKKINITVFKNSQGYQNFFE